MLPGSSRNRKKLMLIVTQMVTIAPMIRLTTYRRRAISDYHLHWSKPSNPLDCCRQ
jgi:hypothetical protein